MLRRVNSELPDEATVSAAAAVLEDAFRLELQAGFPDFTNLRSRFTRKVKCPGGDRTVVLFESFERPDGSSTIQRLLVAETDAGWRVLNVVE